MDVSKCRDERDYFRNSGLKGLRVNLHRLCVVSKIEKKKSFLFLFLYCNTETISE